MNGCGLHAERLKPDRDNPREVAFIEQWHLEHIHHDLLGLLLRVPCAEDDPDVVVKWDTCGAWKLPLGEPTERDRIVAETLVQWLGSNVGLSFLREALNRSGFELRAKE